MTGDGEQRDVRESLGDLERRLLDLERELRSDASEDATVAAGAPAPPSPRAREPETHAEPSYGGGGGVAAPPAPPPDIDLFAQDARAKVAALRETLDGLTNATDRLRETAQTVVEDHGRALVRLERATGAPTPIVIPSMPAASPPRPEVTLPVEPAEDEPETERPRASVRGPDVIAPEPEAVIETEPPAEVEQPDVAELEAESDAGGPVIQAPPELPTLPPLPWRRIIAVAVAIAIVCVLYALIFGGGGGSSPKKPTAPTGIAATDSSITAAGGGISAIPQLRTGADSDVRRDVCSGRIAAGIDVVTPGGKVWQCAGIQQVAAPVLVASGFARAGKRGRTCVSVPAAPALDKLRRDARATERRDEAVRRAPRSEAFAAGTAFDKRNGLTLLAGASAPGQPCIEPTPATLRDGSYPLATRIILYATAATADTDEVKAAARRLTTYFSGTPPLYAIVMR